MQETTATVQLAAASLLGRLQVQALHGPRVTLTLQRLLPPGLVAAIQASQPCSMLYQPCSMLRQPAPCCVIIKHVVVLCYRAESARQYSCYVLAVDRSAPSQ